MSNQVSAYSYAIGLLARRNYSDQELRQRLFKQGYSDEQIDNTLKQLVEKGYINDQVFCQTLLDKYHREGKYGFNKIRLKLKEKGLSPQLISQAEETYDYASEYVQALKIVERRFRDKDRAKIIRFLQYRGYQNETIRKILDYIF